ncbi:DUF6188 family protein [Nucisporomicrobium flavum]|uniref:DUF6188 family protein n=1 Tax=Nucisporomicrobium flavum TaxID=2785915 RepID=UPI001F2CF63A|nr:DUF6188 family protein [Nucisporomicrobium flavum]
MVAEMDAGWRPRQAQSINVLVGRKLQYLRLGHAIVLTFVGDAQVVIESVARLYGPHGRADVEPGEYPSDALAALLGDVVSSARTRDTGELELGFRSGARLLVEVDAEFESWAVAGPGGVLVVCLAGGELAVWGDTPRS